MLFLSIVIGSLASMLGAIFAIRKRRTLWLFMSLPFLLVPLALYAVIAFACYFGPDCI